MEKDYRAPVSKELFKQEWLSLFKKENSLEKITTIKNCSLKHVKNIYSYYKDEIKNKPRILLFDIETLPLHVRVWGLHKQRIPHTNIIHDWVMLSWSGKWLMEAEMYSDILTSKEVLKRNDKRITKSMWKMIDEADIIVAHNLFRFDNRRINTKFFLHGLNPPSPYQGIDTLKQYQKNFALSSYKLDYIGELIRNKGKTPTDYSLWIACEEGKQSALDEMLQYNKDDVTLLEEVYLKVRPWIKSHPNTGLYMNLEKPVCTNCGSTELKECGIYVTPANRYVAMRCVCGAIGRLKASAMSKEESKNLIIRVAR